MVDTSHIQLDLNEIIYKLLKAQPLAVAEERERKKCLRECCVDLHPKKRLTTTSNLI